MSVEETRSIAADGAKKAIKKLINDNAAKGFNSLDLSTYETLYLTEEILEDLKKEGYIVSWNGKIISW